MSRVCKVQMMPNRHKKIARKTSDPNKENLETEVSVPGHSSAVCVTAHGVVPVFDLALKS